MALKRTLLWLCLLRASAMAMGATYYVATNGNDSAAGSSNAPWATLQRSSQNLAPGDTVIVRAGNYAGLYLTKNGASGAPISFLADSGATITNRNSTNGDGIDLEGCSWITIDGFTFSNPLGTNGISRAGVRSCSNGSSNAVHVVIRRCTAVGCGNYGIFTSHSDYLLIESNECSGAILQHGIYVSNACVGPTLRGNRSHDNCGCGLHFNGDISQGGSGLISNALIECNIIYNNGLGGPGVAANGGSGINCDGVQDSTIRNNLLFRNHGSGIALFKTDAAQGARRDVVANNTIVQASDGKQCLTINTISTSNTVLNNILYNENSFSLRGSIQIDASSLPGFCSDNNIGCNKFSDDDGGSFITLAQWQGATGQDAHSTNSTPAALFVSEAASNYLLCAGSPAIDKGVSALNGKSAPTVDLAGNSRPIGAGFDIGAYEYGSATQQILTIVSAHGTCWPAVGIYTNPGNTVLTNVVANVDTEGGTQYVAAGWVMTGNIPTNGTTTNCTLTLTNNAVLTWQWSTNVLLLVSATNGGASPSNAWEGYGSHVLVTATPSNYYAFAGWSGQTNDGVIGNNQIMLTMNSACALQALFTPLLATNNVPQWWLAQYGWTNNFDSAALSLDSVGVAVWKDYLTGTNPTNPLLGPLYNIVPYAEGFENLTGWGGVYTTVAGAMGWSSGAGDQSQITNLSYTYTTTNPPLPGLTHTNVLQLNTQFAILTNSFGGGFDMSGTLLYLDMMVQFVPSVQFPPNFTLADTGEKGGVCVTVSNQLAVYHGVADSDGTLLSNTVDATSVIVSSNAWHRLTMVVDATATNQANALAMFQVMLDGAVVTNANTYADGWKAQFNALGTLPSTTTGTWFRLATTNAVTKKFTALCFSGTGYADDIVVSTVNPFVTSNVTYFLIVTTTGNGVSSLGPGTCVSVPVAMGVNTQIVYMAGEWYRIATLAANTTPVPTASGVRVFTQVLNNVSANISNAVAFALATSAQAGYTNVPVGWLANWTEEAVQVAKGRDGFGVHDKYLLGLDPTSSNSCRLLFDSLSASGSNVVIVLRRDVTGALSPDGMHGTLIVQGSPALAGGGFTNIPSTTVTGSAVFDSSGRRACTNALDGGVKFYKAVVQ